MVLKNIFFILFLWIPIASFAQKEANIWYFGHGAGLDFNYDPPRVLLDGVGGAHEGTAVMADQNGQLLFYTNGERVWNKHHQLMENGTDLGGHESARQSSVIVSVPGKDRLYYILTMDAHENSYKNGLMYSVVDLKANYGLGKVVEKGIQLHVPGTESLSVVGSCVDGEDQDYWVVAANKEYPDKVYAYKIDAGGVNREPVVSSFKGSSNLKYIKFSPAANKAVLIDQVHLGDENPRIIIADFDFSSGVFYNPNYINVAKTGYFNQAEFSPNGKFLYVSSGSEIWQIDLLADYKVSDVLDTESGFKGEFQLAPDGNIYISTYFEDKLSMISNPNERGLEGTYHREAIDLKGKRVSLGLPNFERSLFYNGLNPNAGNDTLICSGQELALGMAPEEGAFYEWYPSDYLSSTNISDPVFKHQNNSDTIQTFEYVLTAYNEVCAKKDTVNIQVFPSPPVQVNGSKSACPGVVEVEYSVPEKEGYNYQWEVEGGTIAAGQGTAILLVDWGPTNPEAIVRLISTHESGCESPVLELPVRINVELDTETPQGATEVCANQRQGIPYLVTNTNGSVYTWNISGGTITEGQGSHQVWVNWDGTGKHALWVQEKSVTVDTVCFGVSDKLEVLVFNDTTEFALDYVSISLQDDEQSEIQGNRELAAVASENFTLFRRAWGTQVWEVAGESSRDSIYFTDGPLRSDEVSYEYMLSSRNLCGEVVSSLPHRTILLSGEAHEEKEEVMLRWSPYTGWAKGVEKYEIWRRVDEEEDYLFAGITDGQTLQYTAGGGADGFVHSFRIKAVENESGHTSWSNEISLHFRHELRIPNVFTPNGDDSIEKLEMYPDNELTIYNRWGQLIYTKKGYQDEWKGEGSPAGLYFYNIRLTRNGRQFRGWVQLVRKEEGKLEK